MIRTKIKTNPLPRITGAEAEFYNPYEPHKQNLNTTILFPKEYPTAFWDENLSIFWNGEFAVKMQATPKVPKNKELEAKELPDFQLTPFRATLFAEFSVQKETGADKDTAFIHATDELRQIHCMYDAKIVDAIRSRHPEAKAFICIKMHLLCFYTGNELVGCAVPRLVPLTEHQIERMVELGFDKIFHISTETAKEPYSC